MWRKTSVSKEVMDELGRAVFVLKASVCVLSVEDSIMVIMMMAFALFQLGIRRANCSVSN